MSKDRISKVVGLLRALAPTELQTVSQQIQEINYERNAEQEFSKENKIKKIVASAQFKQLKERFVETLKPQTLVTNFGLNLAVELKETVGGDIEELAVDVTDYEAKVTGKFDGLKSSEYSGLLEIIRNTIEDYFCDNTSVAADNMSKRNIKIDKLLSDLDDLAAKHDIDSHDLEDYLS